MSDQKHELPLLAPLTTLQFSPEAAQRYYILNKLPVPKSLSYEKQLADIERVTPKGRKFLEDTQEYYEGLRADKGGHRRRKTQFDLPELAKKNAFALAGILGVMAESYRLPLPLDIPVTDKIYEGLINALGLKKNDNPYSLDIILQKWINLSPAHHLSWADKIDEIVAYLALKNGIELFALDPTDGPVDGEEKQFLKRLKAKAYSIRKTYSEPLKKVTKPPSYVLQSLLFRLSDYLRTLTGTREGAGTLIAAIIKKAPYSKYYHDYKDLNVDYIRKLLATTHKNPFL